MSDFAQTGLITTLQRLSESNIGTLEDELIENRSLRPIALVLPCHASELHRAALPRMVAELEGASWISEIIVSMNGGDASVAEQTRALFARLPVRVLWHEDAGPAPHPAGGKGRNVAEALRLLCAEGKAGVIALQDCDVASFRRSDLVRLCYSVAVLGYDFAKAYYSRVTDRLYGRVTRLFIGPLLHACVRVAGHQPLLDFLLSFRYPLSGEVAFTRELAASLPIASGWGLEISMLCDVFRHTDPRRVCQVDCGTGYDHKHQPAETALADMTSEIAAELFRQLAAEGLPGTSTFRASIADAYRREATHAVERSAALARINGLPHDGEPEIVAIFADRLDRLAAPL